jgi:hypothetical protein
MKADNNFTTKNINDTVKSNGSNTKQLMDNNNCSVLALAEAFEVAYDEAYKYAQETLNRMKSKGVITGKIINVFNSGIKILGKKVSEAKAVTKYRQSNGKMLERRMKISTFIKKYPKGTYYILVRGHALVIKDGTMYDHKGFADKLGRPVKYAWKVK